MERLNFVIYTINKTSFDKLDYAISELENVNNFIELIKKINKNITITRKHKVFIKQSKYPTLQYNLVDRLNIKFYGLHYNTIETFVSDSTYYEINIDYSDITELDIVNYDSDRLCININTKNNGKFELVFSDSVEANEFYKKLQNHLPKI